MVVMRKRSHPLQIYHHIKTECETEAEVALVRYFQKLCELLSPQDMCWVEICHIQYCGARDLVTNKEWQQMQAGQQRDSSLNHH